MIFSVLLQLGPISKYKKSMYHFNLDLIIIRIRWCALNMKIGPSTALAYILLSFQGSLMLTIDLFCSGKEHVEYNGQTRKGHEAVISFLFPFLSGSHS